MSHHSGPLVKRLRHRPFTAVSRVRFPDGSPYGRLAQLGERLPYKQDVGSSILSSSTTCGNSSAVEHRLAKAGVASSNLVSRSIHSSIAQLVEQSAVNRSVVGSSPTRGANFIWPVGQAVKTPPFHGGIPGSIPGRVTIWTISSAGRAPALQAGCRQFDPVIVHQRKRLSSDGRFLLYNTAFCYITQ